MYPLLTGYPADYYSVVWEGYLKAKEFTERYRLYVDSEDYYSILVTLDDEIIINTLDSHHCFGDVVLEENKLHKIRIEYVEKKGRTRIRLLWESDTVEKEIIPNEQLFNTLYSSTTPLTVLVIPRDTHQMFVDITSGYEMAVVDALETHYLTAHDLYSNQ